MKDLKEAGVAHPTGNPVIPLVDKKPLVTKWQLKTREALLASSMWPSANNYGIRLDDLTVIDVDDGDPDDALKYLGIDTEPTGRVRTNRGYHLFFKGKTETSKFEGNGTKGDILSGNTRFVVGWEYPDGDIQELPSEWSPPRRAKTAGAGWEYPLLKDVPEGRRHKRFLSASHKLTAAGLTEGTVLAALRSENKLMAKPLPDKQIADTARDGFAFESARLAHPAQMAIYSPEELKLEGRKAKMGRFQRRSLGKAAPPPTSVDCNDRPLTFAEEAQSHYGHPKTGKTWSALGPMQPGRG